MSSLFERSGDFIASHPGVDVAIAVAVGLIAFFLPNPTASGDAELVAGIYSSASAVAALVGGLGSLAVATYSGGKGTRLRQLRASQGPELRRNFAAMLGATFVGAVVTWSAQIVMLGSEQLAWTLATAGLTLAGVTVLRQALLFGSLLELTDADSNAKTPPVLKPQMDEAIEAARQRNRGAA